MKISKEEIIIGFFYAPGGHQTEERRVMFYDKLRKGIDRYKEKNILGDSNARLGEFLGDKDIHGSAISNSNRALLMGLIEYTGLEYLNRIYARGEPTYEIWHQKKSIIDVGMTNNISRVKNFKVYPKILGTNAQTCQKIIELTLRIETYREEKNTENVKKFRYCTDEATMRARKAVAIKCKFLRLLRGSRPPSI